MCLSTPIRKVTRRPTDPALVLAFVMLLSALASHSIDAAERDKNSFQGDAQMQKIVIIRVSRMPIADLLQRLDAELGVALSAEGEDVADQKLDLFTHGKAVTAAEILTDITDLLNAQAPPKSYHWERSGRAPNFRYALVRDVASRQWEEQQAGAADARMARVLRERFAELGRQPFRPESAGKLELPSMRKLLLTLTDEQFARLCSERDLSLKPEGCTPAQRDLLRQLVQELVAAEMRRSPKDAEAALARSGPLEKFEGGGMGVLIRGVAPRYTIEIGVDGPYPIGQLGYLGEAVDAASFAVGRTERGPATPVLAPGEPDPTFALPAHTSWLMGDVLADIAARGRINLVADDYTQNWSKLGRYSGARPLSAWLGAIREEYGFEPSRDGSFVRLRNPVWWLDAKREIPIRLLTRWRTLLQGTSSDRLKMLVEIAQLAPYSPHPRLLGDRLQLLEQSPEMAWTVNQEGARSLLHLIDVVSNRQSELLFYNQLPPGKQEAVLGPGLLVQWSELPPEMQQYFVHRFWPIKDADTTRSISLFMRYSGDHLQFNWAYPMGRGGHQVELFVRPQPDDDVRQLVGKPTPDLEVAAEAEKTTTLRPRGPALLYVTPAWPRPVVTGREEFQDLKALVGMAGLSVTVLGTEATAAELRDWWKERGIALPALALRPASAQRLGVCHLPLAIALGGGGRVTWVKEGYAPGDEAEWRRQLERAGG